MGLNLLSAWWVGASCGIGIGFGMVLYKNDLGMKTHIIQINTDITIKV